MSLVYTKNGLRLGAARLRSRARYAAPRRLAVAQSAVCDLSTLLPSNRAKLHIAIALMRPLALLLPP